MLLSEMKLTRGDILSSTYVDYIFIKKEKGLDGNYSVWLFEHEGGTDGDVADYPDYANGFEKTKRKTKVAMFRRSDALYGVIYKYNGSWHFSGGCNSFDAKTLRQLQAKADEYWTDVHCTDWDGDEGGEHRNQFARIKFKDHSPETQTRIKLNRETLKGFRQMIKSLSPKLLTAQAARKAKKAKKAKKKK